MCCRYCKQPLTRLEAYLLLAECHAKAGEAHTALAHLETVVADARRVGFPLVEYVALLRVQQLSTEPADEARAVQRIQ